VLHGHAIHDVVDQAAVELVPVVEPAATQPGEPAAEQAEPHVAGLRVDVQGRDDLPGQAVLFVPALDLARLLVVAGQAVFRADPDLGPGRLDGEDVVVGQPVVGGEVFPVGVDVRQPLVGRRLRRRARLGARRSTGRCRDREQADRERFCRGWNGSVSAGRADAKRGSDAREAS